MCYKNEEYLKEEYEFYDEWKNRPDEEAHISLDDYNDMRCAETYGDPSPFADDDDSNDKYWDSTDLY